MNSLSLARWMLLLSSAACKSNNPGVKVNWTQVPHHRVVDLAHRSEVAHKIATAQLIQVSVVIQVSNWAVRRQ